MTWHLLDRILIFRGGVGGKEGVTFLRGGGWVKLHKQENELFNNLKSDIYLII